MEVLTHAEGFKLSNEQQDAISEKIGRLDHYEPRAMRARVHMRLTTAHPSPTQFQAKVEIEVPGHNLHAEEKASQPIEAIDLVFDKLEQQLERRKTERMNKRHEAAQFKEAQRAQT